MHSCYFLSVIEAQYRFNFLDYISSNEVLAISDKHGAGILDREGNIISCTRKGNRLTRT